jgi:uncharacterized membrane protein
MTAKGLNVFMNAFMVGIIVLAFLLNIFFPTLPWYFYLVLAVVGGAILLLLYKHFERGLTEAVSDERTTLVSMKASFLTFRVTFPATMLAACILLSFPSAGTDRVFAGRALMLVAAGQGIIMSISAFVFDRRSR